jgi:hypothetical protein
MTTCDADILGNQSTPEAFAKAHLKNCIFGLKICEKQAHHREEAERYAEYVEYLTDWLTDIPSPVPAEEVEREKISQTYETWEQEEKKLESEKSQMENTKMLIDAIYKLAGSSTPNTTEYDDLGSGMSEDHLRAEMAVQAILGDIHRAGESAALIAEHDKDGSYVKDLREAATQLQELIEEIKIRKQKNKVGLYTPYPDFKSPGSSVVKPPVTE